MKHPVRLERQNGVALIAIENPPVNALSTAVRRGILGALGAALSDDAIKAIVIAANGKTFPAGADISEFGQPFAEPDLPELCDLIEGADKPVIAALHGTVLGGGLELAMAAHYRIAHEDTKLGLPEIKLGLLPGAGGTQRAPRLVGVDVALDMMLTGAPITAAHAQRAGLVDGLAGDDLRDVVKALAAETTDIRRTRDLRRHLTDGAAYMARITQRRAALGKDVAPHKIVDCVEAALLLPFDAGRQVERTAFAECLATPRSAGLRHSFFAERRAAKFAELAHGHVRPIEGIGILGGGALGVRMAINCLDAGLPVTLVEQGEAGVGLVLDRIGAHYQQAVSAGRMSEGQGAAALTHLNLTTDFGSLRSADIIIEALPEQAGLRQAAFDGLGKTAKPRAVLATTSAYADLSELQRVSTRASEVVALHSFPALPGLDGMEIGVPAGVDPAAVTTAHAFAKMLGKLPIRSAAHPGLVGAYLMEAARRAADRLLLDGATPDRIDAAMRSFGMALGPYQAMDLMGLRQGWMHRKSHPHEPDPRYLALADRMCEAGWFGREAGRGYYVYAEGETHSVPNSDMLQLLAEERRSKGITTRSFTDRQMRDQIILTWVNEGARLVGNGIATRPSDVDALLVHGFGYPRGRGGPMQDADQTTTFQILRRVEILHEADPTGWDIAPLLRELAAERQNFGDLNG
ncbi:enoyl-CoA hydratase-related protein [uncultured Litoreibacter sp.]|uniref:enoyl-CoA hydratase-related protein n=1 Tax=uncultured Litoreibacter sp. TaxID=1392394 RepID=UPI002625CB96|nr:enoyl-CoA hydratase-related protein [uncultured Litoreibacter sp.]